VLATACAQGRCSSPPGSPVAATAPVIVTPPQAQAVKAGQPAAFSVEATGTAPLHYAWRRGATPVGEDAATLALAAAALADAGSYTVTVSNAAGSVESAPATLTVTPALPDGVAWADEFDGPAIDTTKWAFDLGNGPMNPGPLYGWGNGEWQYYTSFPENAAIEDGKLVITARRENHGGKPFTSARLVTRGKYAFNQGRFVARLQMPEGNRMWPAFWLLGDRVEPWPYSGEIDIAEMFAGPVGTGDASVFATAHWFDDAAGTKAKNGKTYTAPEKLSAGFHDYELEWDATTLRGKIDGTTYWTHDITAPGMSELRDHSYYIVLNLAVGSPEFGMTSPAQADGPMPQRLVVDWVRVYETPGSTVVDKLASQPRGRLCVLADGAECARTVALDAEDPDAELFLWNNLAQVTRPPAAGSDSVAVQTQGGAWFGFGYAATRRVNLLSYAAGHLNVSIRTTSTNDFKIGINGGNDGDAWVDFKVGADPYGFARDGQWHAISIPMTRFAGADFSDIRQYFMVAGAGVVTPGAVFEFDEISWTQDDPANVVRPAGTRFGVLTERACDAGSFTPPADGAVDAWNPGNGALSVGAPAEGTSALAMTAPAAQWWGLGLTAGRLYDLSAFANGHLHLSLAVPASTTTDFKLGLKSPGGQNVRESWIRFARGADPYGLVRDGQYHELVIPASAFVNSDLSAVSILLMVAGDGPANLRIDDVYWTVD